jgi:hypothetical protein
VLLLPQGLLWSALLLAQVVWRLMLQVVLVFVNVVLLVVLLLVNLLLLLLPSPLVCLGVAVVGAVPFRQEQRQQYVPAVLNFWAFQCGNRNHHVGWDALIFDEK